MKAFNIFLWLLLIFLSLLLFMKLSFRFLYWLFSSWYITLPLFIILYFLIFPPRRRMTKRKDYSNLDPSKEIKLEEEAEIRDDDNQQNEEGDN